MIFLKILELTMSFNFATWINDELFNKEEIIIDHKNKPETIPITALSDFITHNKHLLTEDKLPMTISSNNRDVYFNFEIGNISKRKYGFLNITRYVDATNKPEVENFRKYGSSSEVVDAFFNKDKIIVNFELNVGAYPEIEKEFEKCIPEVGEYLDLITREYKGTFKRLSCNVGQKLYTWNAAEDKLTLITFNRYGKQENIVVAVPRIEWKTKTAIKKTIKLHENVHPVINIYTIARQTSYETKKTGWAPKMYLNKLYTHEN